MTDQYRKLLSFPSVEFARRAGCSVSAVKRLRREKLGPLTEDQKRLRQRLGALVAANAKRERTAERVEACRRDLGEKAAINEVARRLGLNRSTVRGYWRDFTFAGSGGPRNDSSLDAGIRDQLKVWGPRLIEIGWPPGRIWNGDFRPHSDGKPRGLASILQPGDRLVSADDQWIYFIKRDGTSAKFSREK
jgi:hypothetical protein